MREDGSVGFGDSHPVLGVLLEAAVAEALRTEQPEPFLRWMREDGASLLADLMPGAGSADLAPVAAHLGYSIWNTLPLPSNGFRPRPLPKPHRNDPCLCGSGLKYKRCCANAPEFPALGAEALWPLVVELLPQKVLAEAIEHHRIPAYALAALAEARLDAGDAQTAIAWLEPFFAADLKGLRQQHSAALYALCDAYDALGKSERKLALLERVIEQASGETAADAAQRLATIALDSHDSQAARRYFERAMRLNADDPMLALLELQLLLLEGNTELARRRAGFWLQRLQRGPYEPPPYLLEVLAKAQDDPGQVLSELFAPMMGDAIERIRAWITRIAERPLPAYALERVERAPDDMAAAQAQSNPYMLKAPPPLMDLESRWHRLYPVAKPLGISLLPLNHQEIDPLGSADVEAWLGFLEAHPAAADSLDILDDLLILLLGVGMDDQPWLQQQFLQPLLLRARAIVQAALDAAADAAALPWELMENRPALRILDQHASNLRAEELAKELRWLLQLNPGDHHGWRSVLMDLLLQQGQDAEAAALSARYPDDMMVETLYGRALALHRLGEKAAAAEALDLALDRLPTVAAFLTGRRRAQPQQEYPGVVTVGGDDQAYLYAVVMREVWQDSPGALDLVRRRVRARKQK